MAINPSIVSTVQTKDLPVAPISFTDNFAHEVGDILSVATIQQLFDFFQSHITTAGYKYEIKHIRAPSLGYITTNFNMAPGSSQGIGTVGGLWEGWAICNGNNGTDNLDGRVLMGYGATHATVGDFLGSADTILVSHTHDVTVGNVNNGQTGGNLANKVARWDSGSGTFLSGTTTSSGTSGEGKNIQPSMVILAIMKL